jgi:hypothetical protein
MKRLRAVQVLLTVLWAGYFSASSGVAVAQERVDGVILQHGMLGSTSMPDEFQVTNRGGIKGAKKVAISVFNVAFPRENHFTATSRGSSILGGFSTGAAASLKTTLKGLDKATMQRIADRAYAGFVSDLEKAGFEVMDAPTLAQLAPEYTKWKASANFTEGRFGPYVAPTGRSVFLLQGDTAGRDTSGMMGQQLSMFRVLDRPEAVTRSPYLAHDASIGIIAVTLVLDYGVYSSSGEKHAVFAGASAGFKPGLTAVAGNAVDRGSLLEYWGPASGGFPSDIFLQLPVRSEEDFATIDTSGEADATLTADPAKYEAAANGVGAIALAKLAGVLAGAR